MEGKFEGTYFNDSDVYKILEGAAYCLHANREPKLEAKVDEIIALYDSPAPLTDADRGAMDKIRADLGTSFCHRCEYCQPCEKEVKIPGVLNFRSVIKRLMPAAAITMASAAMESAENCDECGECIEKCPYDLPIPDLLKENLALYRDFVKQHQ